MLLSGIPASAFYRIFSGLHRWKTRWWQQHGRL